ncbi:MAG TPA: FecR family protein, partial [Pyrinomonadaceae bacterium]
MNVNARPNSIKLWPHLSLVFLVCALLGGVAAALWMRHEPKAEALALPRAARVERVDGEVGLSRDLAAGAEDEANWVELTPNTPLTVGDRLYARDDSRAAIAFTGRNFAAVDPNSALDVVSLSDRRTQLALRDGSAIFDIGALGPDEMFEVATPYGAVDFREPGLYQVGYNDDGSAFVSVLSGLAQVVGLAGSGQIGKGEMLTLLGQTAAQVALSRLGPDYAGGLVDDYYGYRYPDDYDGRYGDYDAYLNDPDYYDPYDRHESYRHVPGSVPGAYDLDDYGDWQ